LKYLSTSLLQKGVGGWSNASSPLHNPVSQLIPLISFEDDVNDIFFLGGFYVESAQKVLKPRNDI
jgi:hypothetical protein